MLSDWLLSNPPADRLERNLWLQHATGFILVEAVKAYAVDRVDRRGLTGDCRQAALEAIDDTLYGLSMVAEGVTGPLGSEEFAVDLRLHVRLLRNYLQHDEELIEDLDLYDGDGMCMGHHMWMEGDFGEQPIATRRGGVQL